MDPWKSRLYAAEADDGGGDDDGGDAPPADTGPNVMEMKLGADEALPEKLRGKSVQDVLRAYQNAEKLIGKKDAELAKLRDKPADDAASGPKFDRSAFLGVLDAGRSSGMVEPEKLRATADMLGVDEEDLTEVVQWVHQRYTQTITRAQEAIDETFKDENGKPQGINVSALLEYANKSDAYTAEDLRMFNTLLKRGSSEPFKLIIEDLQKAGIDPASLKSDGRPETAKDTKATLPNPLRGRLGGLDTSDEFKSRAEYMAARLAAGNDPTKQEEVERRLKASRIHKWADTLVRG